METLKAPFVAFDNYLGSLANGQRVFDRNPEERFGRTLKHIHIRRPQLNVALSLINPDASCKKIEKTIEFPKIVGLSSITEVDHNDKVFWARRRGKKGLSKFVENKDIEETAKITVILIRKEENPAEWVLLAAFYGEFAGPEPFSPDANPESLKFWQGHALVPVEHNHYDSGSVVYDNPW